MQIVILFLYRKEYVERLQDRQKSENKNLSLFELNLETWRQLWRVLELSDILLIIVDVRYAVNITKSNLWFLAFQFVLILL